MFVCECDFRDGFCGLTMPVSVYDTLSNIRADTDDRDDSDLYIVHEDHAAGEQEIAREGEWVLVQAATGGTE